MTAPLAQEDAPQPAETEGGLFQPVEGDPARPLTEWLDQRIENDLLVQVLDSIIEPALQILLIVVLAVLAVGLARRGIRRAVTRVKQPPTEGTGRRRRARLALGDGERQAKVSLRRVQRADALGALASSVVGVVVWVIAVLMMLGTFGLQLGPFIAGAGIIGVAVGFGAQDLVKDFLSGVFMLIEDQYGVGDIIDVGEATGVVEAVGLRSTRVRDVTGTLWHVPNGEIRRVGNMSQEWARALLDISVSYGTDLGTATQIIQRVAEDMAHEDDYATVFLDEPEVWGVQDLGPDSVDIRLVIKTQPGEQWAIARELRRRIKAAFDAADVEIPFPQRTVWLRTEEPLSLGKPDGATAKREADRGRHRPDPAAIERAVAAAPVGDTKAALQRQDVPAQEELSEQTDTLAEQGEGGAGAGDTDGSGPVDREDRG